MMAKAPNYGTQLQRLRELYGDEQATYALELLKTTRNKQVVEEAVQALTENPLYAARDTLIQEYHYYDGDGIKRDAGAQIRAAIIKALKVIRNSDDAPLFERAVKTYEFLPPTHSEEAAILRSAGLIALAEIESPLVDYHAVRILIDKEHTSEMSGEPAVTAVHVLSMRQNTLPIYQYVLQNTPKDAETLSESLKSLCAMPGELLPEIVEKYKDTEDDVILLGLFDLIVNHAAGEVYHDYLLDFLTGTRRYQVYHYLVTIMATNRKCDLMPVMILAAEKERDRRKLASVLEALALVRGNKHVASVALSIQRKLSV
jgi:hypothetical protein